jgi:hypothetical protein
VRLVPPNRPRLTQVNLSGPFRRDPLSGLTEAADHVTNLFRASQRSNPVLALVATAFMETENFLSHETSLIPGGTDAMCSLQSARKLEIEADY